jgi:hypothetical protein
MDNEKKEVTFESICKEHNLRHDQVIALLEDLGEKGLLSVAISDDCGMDCIPVWCFGAIDGTTDGLIIMPCPTIYELVENLVSQIAAAHCPCECDCEDENSCLD